MQSRRRPKVCFPVAGKPAIVRLLEGLTALGVGPTILVVGHLAGKVVEEVGPRFPKALFTYQAQLLGTGHAAKQGAEALRQLGFEGGVLLVAGDKVIEARALRKLCRVFQSERPDVALLVGPKDRWPNAGRLVTDAAGGVVRIIERADLADGERVGRSYSVNGAEVSASEIEAQTKWVNQAVYLFRSKPLFAALERLDTTNVQREEYLTDAVGHIVNAGGRAVPVLVDDPDDVLAFNNPEELLEIEEHFRRQAGLEIYESMPRDPRIFRPPLEWAELLRRADAPVRSALREIYGDSQTLREEKRKRLLDTVERFIDRFGGQGVVTVIRAPGRVNLMGRHVDHRGGCVNLMAIDREHIVVARPRNDAVVRARNADEGQFADLEFAVGDLLEQVGLDDWREFVNSEIVLRMVRDLAGDWGNYLKAPMLRLQQQYQDRLIHGVDCMVSGDIPMAAGLSSSSALVVAMAEALVLSNRLDVSPHDLVDVCGEGEWFVGTRGGSADHAAVKLSQPGNVAHVGFFPFTIMGYAPFPKGYTLVICNSRVQARKAAGARDIFNERIASYEFAVRLVRKKFPHFAPLIHHLRDIAPETLGIRATDLYRLLLEVPESISALELARELGDDTFESIARNHAVASGYPLRGRLLYGIAECERSKRAFGLLKEGDVGTLGTLMNVSHDGDRVVGPQGAPYASNPSNDRIESLIAGLELGTPEGEASCSLQMQPGVYACSIPAIDHMVDIALAVPGVLGAQLSGAGLGGCMMVLARADSAEAVIKTMNEKYYAPNHLEPSAFEFTPVAGSAPLVVD
ncbi:MAG: hypothetical protein AMXMBFR4_20070 [Candidatus Hydrogenedentota bacterium]